MIRSTSSSSVAASASAAIASSAWCVFASDPPRRCPLEWPANARSAASPCRAAAWMPVATWAACSFHGADDRNPGADPSVGIMSRSAISDRTRS